MLTTLTPYRDFWRPHRLPIDQRHGTTKRQSSITISDRTIIHFVAVIHRAFIVKANLGEKASVKMTRRIAVTREASREKKRIRIRHQLRRMNIDHRDFRRLCADHIRAIRYLRLRNQELAMLNVFSRLQYCMRARNGSSSQQQDEQRREGSSTIVKLIEWNKPRDWYRPG